MCTTSLVLSCRCPNTCKDMYWLCFPWIVYCWIIYFKRGTKSICIVVIIKIMKFMAVKMLWSENLCLFQSCQELPNLKQVEWCDGSMALLYLEWLSARGNIKQGHITAQIESKGVQVHSTPSSFRCIMKIYPSRYLKSTKYIAIGNIQFGSVQVSKQKAFRIFKLPNQTTKPFKRNC